MNPADTGTVFSAAHAEFTAWSPRLWRPLGEILSAVARTATGDRVLDACAGAGASALPAARAVGPQSNPSGRVDTPDKLHSWMAVLRLDAVTVHQVRFVQPLRPDDAWSFYLSAAMRGFVEGLPPDALARVRIRFLDGLRSAGIDTLDASSLIATAHRR